MSIEGSLLLLVYFTKFRFYPGVPEVERNFEFQTFGVELCWRDSEHKIRILLVINDFESQAAQPEILFFWVFSGFRLPFLRNNALILLL